MEGKVNLSATVIPMLSARSRRTTVRQGQKLIVARECPLTIFGDEQIVKLDRHCQ
jgi:hypothetical protein